MSSTLGNGFRGAGLGGTASGEAAVRIHARRRNTAHVCCIAGLIKANAVWICSRYGVLPSFTQIRTSLQRLAETFTVLADEL